MDPNDPPSTGKTKLAAHLHRFDTIVADGKNAMRKTLEAIALAALALLCWITGRALYGSQPLPNRIPIHFDLSGQPNGWGPPSTLLLLPAVALALYLLITLVSQFPSAFNYPVPVTAENRPRLQALALTMIAWIKAEMLCLFTCIQASIVEAARRTRWGLTPLLVPVSLAVVFGTVGWYLVALRKAARPAA